MAGVLALIVLIGLWSMLTNYRIDKLEEFQRSQS